MSTSTAEPKRLTTEEMATAIGVTPTQIEAAARQKRRIAEIRDRLDVTEDGAIMGIAGEDAMRYE